MRLISLIIFLLICACRPVWMEETAQAKQSIEGSEDPSIISDTIAEDHLIIQRETGLVLLNGHPYSGASVAYHTSHQLATYTEYLNGKKHGLYQSWFSSGQRSFSGYYLEGRRHGHSASWWTNGCLRTESNFVRGTAHGIQQAWYQSGALFRVIRLVDGKEEGLQQAWRENGKLYSNYEAKNGRIYGLKRAHLCYQLSDEVIQ